jgi:hypothetical protein
MKSFFILLFILVFSIYGYSQKREKPFDSSNEKMNMFSFQEQLNASRFILERLDLNFNYFPELTLGGAGKRLGSEVFLFEETTWVDIEDLPDDVIDRSRTDYGDRNIPIVSDPRPDIPFMLDAGYTYNNTRFGLSWLRMSGDNDQSGEVPGFYLTDEENVSTFGYGLVSFWNMGWDLHASRGFPANWFEGFRDLDDDPEANYDLEFFPEKGMSRWNLSHGVSLNSFEFTIQHPVIRLENLEMSLIGGVHHGRWQDNLLQRLEIVFHRELTERWTQEVEVDEDSIMVEVFLTSIIHNDITLETLSSVRFNPLGTLVGIEGEWSIMPSLSLSLRATTSRFRGNSYFSGDGIDIDNIRESSMIVVFDEEGTLIHTDALKAYEYLSGIFELPETALSVTSVNYRMNVALRYHVMNNLFITGGYYHTIWRDLPMAPQWIYSDRFTNPYGAFAVENSWHTDIRSDISMSGFMIGLGVSF